ncbi:putative dehydrogenase [Pyronema omphalodes]|nr:putative dehydrogenase [Pyronema omphalodes]
MASPLSVTVVGGAGLIGRRHVQHVLDEPSTILACLVDPTPAGKDFAASLNVPIYSDLPSLLNARSNGEIKIDAAIIATPNITHVPLGILCINADISALVEKPVSVDGASAISLIQAAERAKARDSTARILVGHHRRHNPYIRATKKAVDSGVFGKVLAIQGTWSLLKNPEYFNVTWRTEVGSGGPILINMIHEIDNMRYIFGDITSVFVERGAQTRSYAVEETFAMTFRFESGMVGTFICSDAVASPYNWESASGENPLIPKTGQAVYTILGTKGSMSVPEMRRWHYDSQSAGSWMSVMEYDDSLKAEIDDILPFTRQLVDLVAVHAGEKEPVCSVEEGTKSLFVIEAITKSMQTRQLVEVEKPAL